MFSCACSLRSTQCAALIALATAAGIMRIEPTLPEAPASPVAGKQGSAMESRGSENAPNYFQASIERHAPWIKLMEFATEVVGEDVASVTSFTAPPCFAPGVFSPRVAFPALSARQHSYPFAVGPPHCEFIWNPRVADTSVSGDSATRRMLVSRVAAQLSARSSARLTRNENPVPPSARAFFKPSSALRGEPEDFFPRHPACYPARIHCRSRNALIPLIHA